MSSKNKKCKKCKGEGIIPDMLERIVFLGISYIFEKVAGDRIGWLTCPKCNGTGRKN